ncbi:hypothetical protein L249_4319 [Ophiocordyceps polyrhachis-furcata BCC 54312]|uniref:Uncharacterized protein n=1 Tax=Ophiocordyceps polyrhachis-furcata BCC 54312 TaxID=1330021 RepID=A0A367L8B7_9HYPO|nr:hypothetical protein L249_4319 [Ophiocordyceps polyrhachis-furcata BCC 54312]
MQYSTGAAAEPPTSWLSLCCYTPFTPRFHIKKTRVIGSLRGRSEPNQPSAVVDKQPFGQQMLSGVSNGRPSPDAPSRRPLISAPSNFRHLRSFGSLSPDHFAMPLESDSHTPLSAQFAHSDSSTISPPPARFSCRAGDEHLLQLYQGNEPSLSFHIPRRQVNSVSPAQDGLPPRIPPKAQGRNRVSTAPEVAALRERVADAMMEVERLQRQIDEVVERQSLYTNSRPSTSHSTGRILPALQPMPSVPALPPVAPSFAQRVYSDGELSPTCAPKTWGDGSPTSPTQSRLRQDGGQIGRLTPRPPLRKKKSFTHVSDWLFPQHNSGTDNRYTAANRRQSFDSASTWDTEEEAGRATPTTTTIPSAQVLASRMERTATFGKNDMTEADKEA